MKTEQEMHSEAQVINRWIDNYTPIHNSQTEADAQSTLNRQHQVTQNQ